MQLEAVLKDFAPNVRTGNALLSPDNSRILVQMGGEARMLDAEDGRC